MRMRTPEVVFVLGRLKLKQTDNTASLQEKRLSLSGTN